jgi:hypothetical protein
MTPLDDGDDEYRLLFRVYSNPLARPWLNNDAAIYADTLVQISQAATLPYYESEPTLSLIQQDVDDLPRTRVLSHHLLPALTGVSRAQARHESTLDLMQMGLLLEQYYVDHGAYPESLDPISPALGGTLPVDPFTGDSYIYRPSGDTFLLYGVGIDRTDEGGVHGNPHGDVVWRGREATD